MTSLLPLYVVVGLVAFSTLLGLVWRAQNGRVRHLTHGPVIQGRDLPSKPTLGKQATLLQFSTEVCAPCRSTHTVLDSLARDTRGVRHIDLDLTARPDLAARFNILQTPTTLILDGGGVVRARIGGAARRDTVVAELDRILLPLSA